jgi:hypothetical protein
MKEGSGNEASLYWNWRDGSFTKNSESYIRHVTERSGNGSALSLEMLREGNLEEGLRY